MKIFHAICLGLSALAVNISYADEWDHAPICRAPRDHNVVYAVEDLSARIRSSVRCGQLRQALQESQVLTRVIADVLKRDGHIPIGPGPRPGPIEGPGQARGTCYASNSCRGQVIGTNLTIEECKISGIAESWGSPSSCTNL